MSTSGPDPTGGDPERVRLSWPGAEQARPTAGPRPRRAPRASDRGAEPVSEVEVPDDIEPAGRDLPRLVRALPVVESEGLASAALRRAVVEAHDRLADRVLQRLRTVREDLDADMTELRSEIGALRESVEMAGDDLALRQIRTSIHELRSEVVALRHAILESPVLARLGDDVAALRDDLAALTGGEVVIPAPGAPGVPVAVADELEALRMELASLRRRIALRASTEEPDVLNDAAINRISEAVAARLRAAMPAPRRR